MTDARGGPFWPSWQKLRDELIRDEGRRYVAYKDTAGNWTIGVGHLLNSDGEPRMQLITDKECTALLDSDTLDAAALAREACPGCDAMFSPEGQVRYRALINMAFNRGRNMVTSSTITPAVNNAIKSGNWSGISSVILQSPWARQVGQRASRLAFMLETGQEPA